MYTNISPNKTSPRTHAIDTITIHCMAAQWAASQCADYFAKESTKASSNYCVGYDGSVAVSVDEADRSWCSSNAENDHRAITIEVASDTTAPYAITDEAYSALCDLLVDVCKRNNIEKLVWSTNKNDRVNHKNGCNMTCHRDYANKACPGEYIYDREGQIADTVNSKLNGNGVDDVIDEPSAYAKSSCEKAIEAGIIKGYGDGTYGWKDSVTREQLMVILDRMGLLK